MAKLTPDEAQELVDAYGGIRPAARGSGFSFGSIHRALTRGRKGMVKDRPQDVQDESVEIAARDLSRLKDEVATLRRRLKEEEREEDTSERIREKIYELSGSMPSPPKWVTESKPGGHAPGVPITLWSDWHWAEVVRPEEVAFMNEFDSEIASRRCKDLVEKVVDLTMNHMVQPEYPGIVVGLDGDIITGDIHMELQDTNDQYTFQACLDVQDHIAAGIEYLLDYFPHVLVPAAPGNHGRNTLKPRMKGRAYTSFEWNIYCQLERYFRNEPRVKFLISPSADVHFKVFDHRIMMTHGDSLGVKGGDGIIGAIGPIMRGAVKVGRSEAQIGRDFDTLMMGHWHQWISLRGLVVNGTLKGYDEFARLGLRAPYERPTQALWFVHPKHGVTAQWPIYLEAKQTSTQEWSSWPKVA
jgi:hypothetical protein